MIETNDENQLSAKKRAKPRPDGTDLGRYKNLEKWSYRRWAWEFLRRNTVFIERCDALRVSATDEEKQEVADMFGLKKFKSYKESYAQGGRKPVFTLGSISSWSNVQKNAEEKWAPSAKLDDGQVLIRFDLTNAVADSAVLDKQLRLAKIRLQNRLEQYSAQVQKEIGRGR